MSLLAEKLAGLDPAFSSSDVALFRSCLAAMVEQIQQKPSLAALTLVGWRQWLDDEGYDVDVFVALLQQICRSSLESTAWSELLSYVLLIHEEPNALLALSEHLQQRYPSLAATLDDLQACALEEHHTLEARAGGLSKKAKLGIEIGLGVTLTGEVATLFVLGHKLRQGAKEIADLDRRIHKLEKEAKAVKSDVVVNLKRDEKKVLEVENKVKAVESAAREGELQVRAENIAKNRMLNRLPAKDLESLFQWEQHDPEVNEVFKSLRLPDGASLKPVVIDRHGAEHWIVRMSGRDIVRVEIDGKEINFYLSTGKALKDQVEWPSDHWYAIPGMGRQAAYDKDDKMIKRDGKVVYSDDEWINKFDKVTSRHYGSDKIREVSRALKVASDAESLSNQLLNNPLDQHPSKTIASINRGLKQMDYAGPLKDQISIYDDLFRGFLKTTLKERYPLAVGPTLDKDVDRLAKDFKTLGDREVLEHYKSWFRRETPDVKQIEKSFYKDLGKTESGYESFKSYLRTKFPSRQAKRIDNLLVKYKRAQDSALRDLDKKRQQMQAKALKKANELKVEVSEAQAKVKHAAGEEEARLKRSLGLEAREVKRGLDQEIAGLENQVKSDISGGARQVDKDLDKVDGLIEFS